MASEMSKYQVFLRIKPLDVSNVDDRVNNEILTSMEPTQVVICHTNKKNEIIKCRFNFEKVFKPSASQSEVFDEVIYPKLVDFFKGKDSLVFSYGTSNSGKSFTMQGTRDHPGIIPRVLHAVFNSVEGRIDEELTLKPFKSCQAIIFDGKHKEKVFAEKCAILESVAHKVKPSLDESLSGTTLDEISESMNLKDSRVAPSCLGQDDVCSVWISFYEVYNEHVYDLLALSDVGLQRNLKLEFDEEDDSYHPKDLTEIHASSWKESYDLYRYGKKNLRVSETFLNRKSSRSHSVFTLRILTRNSSVRDQYLDVRNFILCDLAGSERLKHTSQMGKATAMETVNINASILTLNRCFASLKADTQKIARGNDQRNIVSYRDSKLTMLFKKFLKGQGSLSMVANMSQDTSMFYETDQILRITSLAFHTRVEQKTSDNIRFKLPLVMPKRRFSNMYAHEQSSPVTSRQAAVLVVPHDETKRLKEDNVRLMNEVERKTEETAKLIEEMRSMEASYQERIAQLERSSDMSGYYHEKYREMEKKYKEMEKKNFDLEDKYTIRVMEANKRELKWCCRYDALKDNFEEVVSMLNDAFGIRETAGPKETTSRVIRTYHDMISAAEEEVRELNETYQAQISELERAVSEKDEEICNLKGQLLELELMRQNEEARANLLRKTEASDADNEVTEWKSSDDERLASEMPVKEHGNARWISDDESLLYEPPQTTGKKKKKKRPVKHDIYLYATCTKQKPESSENNNEGIQLRRAKRNLMRRAEDYLGDDLPLETNTPPQSSPSTMLYTLRSGRKRR